MLLEFARTWDIPDRSERYFIGELLDIRYQLNDLGVDIEELFHIIKLDGDREMNYSLLVEWTTDPVVPRVNNSLI